MKGVPVVSDPLPRWVREQVHACIRLGLDVLSVEPATPETWSMTVRDGTRVECLILAQETLVTQ